MTPDDDKLGGFRCVDERTRCPITHEALVHGHVRIAFLPTCQRLGQKVVFIGYCRRPVETWNFGHIGVIPRVQRDQVDVSKRRFLERDRASEVCG